MMTVGQLKAKLADLDDSLPCILVDTRSGVVEEVRAGSCRAWIGSDGDYGVELPVGTEYLPFYVG